MNCVNTDKDVYKNTSLKQSPGNTPNEKENFSNLLSAGWEDTFRRLNPILKKFSWWSPKFKSRSTGRG
jgi:exodeoxyribonuclease-3